MLGQLKSCVCTLQSFTGSRYPNLTRSFAKASKLKPIAVAEVRRRGRGSDKSVDFSRVKDPEIRETLENMDMDLEPSLAHIGAEYESYLKDKDYMRKKFRRAKFARKHFKHMQPQEISVLTYAEKENIRYLNQSNPEYWTPEKLSESFPITPEGVQKLLKSSFRAWRQEDIIQHDERVKERLEKIKAGEISLNPELKQKMVIRENILFKIGERPVNSKAVAIPDKAKKLGEFARLVASPDRIKEYEKHVSEARMLEEEAERKAKLFVKHMTERKIAACERLTLEQFEQRVRSDVSSPVHSSSKTKDPVPEVEYLLGVKGLAKSDPVNASEVVNPSSNQRSPFIRNRVQKFKSKEIQEDERVPVNVEDGKPYIYDSKTGYQMPYAPTDYKEDRIEIPQGKRTPGATYQVGDSFYDEDGEFLYRVV